MVSLRVILSILVIVTLPSVSGAAVGYADWVGLKPLGISVPQCEGRANLDSSSEYFVEIANPLPGRDEYNELIRFYEAQNWSQFEEKMEIFKKAFENSSLREAAAFLEAEEQLSQADGEKEASVKAAEKKLREVLLLYPNSKLVPVILMSAANTFLRLRMDSKALAFFENGRNDHPFHELNCRFLAGTGEARYQLKDNENSLRTFKLVLQKCKDPLAKFIAEVRIADLELPTTPKKSQATYSSIAEKLPVRMAKHTPWALFNAGELKYKSQEYNSSKYFYTEFLKHSKKSECTPWAMKRVADILIQQKAPVSEGVGAHFVIYDKFPNQDIGRFARLHAFLVEISGLPAAEVDRRLQIFDQEVDKISDSRLRTTLYFEKGLALLSLKERAAMPYLVHFNERDQGYISDPAVGKYVRGKILGLLEEELQKADSDSPAVVNAADEKYFEPLEEAYPIWFKGSSFESKAKVMYQKLILVRMKHFLEVENMTAALGRLERWQKSGIWSAGGPPPAASQSVATALLRHYHIADEKTRASDAATMEDKKEVLEPFLSGDLTAVWLTVWMAKNDRKHVAAFLAKKTTTTPSRKEYSPELQSLLNLVLGKAARYAKSPQISQRHLASVEFPSLAVEANRERFELAKDEENPKKMLETATKLRGHLSSAEYLSHLKAIAEVVQAKKTWGMVSSVYKEAERALSEKTDIAPFLLLKGRAEYEARNFKNAIDSYETAVTLSPELGQKPDLKFRLGKCYFMTRQKNELESSGRSSFR